MIRFVLAFTNEGLDMIRRFLRSIRPQLAPELTRFFIRRLLEWLWSYLPDDWWL